MALTIHIDRWVERSEQDFYMLFVKTWIPFNAWYKREIAPSTLKGQDRECINYICTHSNTYKDKILSYLNGTDRQSVRFKQEVADLHEALLAHTIPNSSCPINFKTTTIFDLSNPLEEGDFYSIHYKIERTETAPGSGRYQYSIRVEDKNTHATKYTRGVHTWNKAAIESDSHFMSLSEAIRKRLLECYSTVNPISPTNVVMTPVIRNGVKVAPPHSFVLDKDRHFYFIEDKDKICQVLIQLIYNLRCQIFHGSLDPSTANMPVYEHAYNIQRMIITELH